MTNERPTLMELAEAELAKLERTESKLHLVQGPGKHTLRAAEDLRAAVIEAKIRHNAVQALFSAAVRVDNAKCVQADDYDDLAKAIKVCIATGAVR